MLILIKVTGLFYSGPLVMKIIIRYSMSKLYQKRLLKMPYDSVSYGDAIFNWLQQAGNFVDYDGNVIVDVTSAYFQNALCRNNIPIQRL